MKIIKARLITNADRDSVSRKDNRRINHFRPDFSLVMNFRFLMESAGIRPGKTYQTGEHCLIYVTAGEMEARFNAVTYHMRPHAVIVLPEFITIELLSASDDFNARALAFKVQDSEAFAFIQYDTFKLDLTALDADFIESYFMLFDKMFARPVKNSKPIECMTTLMMWYLYRLHGTTPTAPVYASRPHEIFNGFVKLVSKNALKNRNVTFYANLLKVTPNYLNAVVRGKCCKSAKEWIDTVVIREAKMMLRGSKENLVTIAKALGFNNPAQFGTFFKKETGKTPGEYRDSQGV